MKQLPSNYDHQRYEPQWARFWEEKQLFKVDVDPQKKPYVILMPPPNVTSKLHMGHGTCYTFQDILIRWKRMQGFNAHWQAGTDHAGIATQMMVEKDLLARTGQTRHDVGREAFVKLCQQWKDKYGDIIYEQFKRIGFSADWSRKAYTMDPHLSYAVRYVFVQLFNEGLIYRGLRLVNWDPVLKTAISDDEIEQKEIQGHLWHIRYPLIDGSAELIVATTRPETMLGDVAVAVHPDDERYQGFIGKKLRLPLVGREIPVIADGYVKAEFGSGAVKITPAHDPNDFEMGQRHQLPVINIFDEQARLNDQVPEPFQGLDRYEARKKVIAALKEQGFLVKEEAYRHVVPHSDRSKAVIEPRLSQQWFLKMSSLAKPAADAARTGDLRFFPESWRKTYLHWLDHVQDWCISRQLWWGHRIPVWYCRSCEKTSSAMEDLAQCAHCGSSDIYQDEDVLDTWFSSWLWPLSPFGWPDEKEEKRLGFDYFYPSQVLMTAPEIIFLWVARMIMAGLKFTGALPFKDLYFSAVVTDKQGRKFSKTLGNGIDPLELIEKYGADATRFSAVSLAPLGGRIAMDQSDFEQGQRFVNKLWNAARFILNHVSKTTEVKPLSNYSLTLWQKWLLTQLATTTDAINNLLDQYRLNEAVEKIYHFIWGSYCDWAIELAKQELDQPQSIEEKERCLSVLVYALDQLLRLVHPIMPFVTEELWQRIPRHPDLEHAESICVARYPEASTIMSFDEESALWQQILDLISSIRSARQRVGLSSKQHLKAIVKTSEHMGAIIDQNHTAICRLARLTSIQTSQNAQRPAHSLLCVGQGFEAYLPVEGLVDFSREKQRIEQELHRLEKIITGLDKKLQNKNFIQRAPAEVVTKTQLQKENLTQQWQALKQSLDHLLS